MSKKIIEIEKFYRILLNVTSVKLKLHLKVCVVIVFVTFHLFLSYQRYKYFYFSVYLKSQLVILNINN